jgi:Tfp pilus assembly protein PilX
MNANRPDRRGLMIIPALVCLVIVALLCSILLKQVHTQRGQVRWEERRMQAEWLAESGLARAAARLAANRGYKGETWEIPAKALAATSDGVVQISVEAIENQPARRRVRVVADYPRADDRRARQSKHLIVNLGPETSGGPS